MKIKHTKYGNTGLLFEMLVKQMAADTIEGKDSAAFNLVKKHFGKDSYLYKENKLYDFVLSKVGTLSSSKADTVIQGVVEVYRKLNHGKLKKARYDLVKEMKESYDIKDIFSIKVKNYKTYAALYCLLESYSSDKYDNPQEIITHKNTIVESLTSDKKIVTESSKTIEAFSNSDADVRILTQKLLLKKFNEQYKDLLPKQKEIIKEFITSADSRVKLTKTVNQNLKEVSNFLETSINSIEDPVLKIKLEEIKSQIPSEEIDRASDKDVLKLLQYIELTEELKSCEKK